MDDTLVIKDSLDKDIIGLLAVSKLPALEKRLWVNTLSHLTKEEKIELKANLEKEVDYEIAAEEKAIGQLVAAAKKSA